MLVIVVQGLIDFSEGGFVYCFYIDDDIMFQVVLNDCVGQDVIDVIVFVFWDSVYLIVVVECVVWVSWLKVWIFIVEGLFEYE